MFHSVNSHSGYFSVSQWGLNQQPFPYWANVLQLRYETFLKHLDKYVTQMFMKHLKTKL